MGVKFDDWGYSTTQVLRDESFEAASRCVHLWVSIDGKERVGSKALDGCNPNLETKKFHVNEGRYWEFETFSSFVNRLCGSRLVTSAS